MASRAGPGAYKEGLRKLFRGDVAGSASHFEGMVESDPADPGGYRGLGYLAAYGNQEREAVEHFKKALGLGDVRADTRLHMGNAYKILGMHDEAMACYREAASIQPDMVAAHLNMACLHILGGTYEAAVASADEALKADPLLADAQTVKGIALINMGEHARGKALVLEAARDDPGSDSAVIGMAYGFLAGGELHEALGCLDSMPGGEPADLDGLYKRARRLYRRRDYAGAYKGYAAAAAREPMCNSHAGAAASFVRMHRGDPDGRWMPEALELTFRAVWKVPSYAHEYLDLEIPG